MFLSPAVQIRCKDRSTCWGVVSFSGLLPTVLFHHLLTNHEVGPLDASTRRSLPPVFKSRRGHIWRLFHHWLRLITCGGRSAHLAYLVHKSGRKTSSSSSSLQVVGSFWFLLSFVDVLWCYRSIYFKLNFTWGSSPGMGISEECFIFDFASLPLQMARPI